MLFADQDLGRVRKVHRQDSLEIAALLAWSAFSSIWTQLVERGGHVWRMPQGHAKAFTASVQCCAYILSQLCELCNHILPIFAA